MITIETALADITKLGLDTVPIIYFVEAHPQYDALVTQIFQRIDDGELVGVTSVITLTEVLTQPLQHGASNLQTQYRNLLTNSDNFELVPINISVAEHAANLRAQYNLSTPDALQIAAALSMGCQAFVTNDHKLRRVTELSVIMLDDLIVASDVDNL